jgi:hypothetical protein
LAVVAGGNTVTFGAGDSYTGANAWYNGLGVGGAAWGNPGAGTLNITGGEFNTGGFFVGHEHEGTINLSGGTLNASGQHMLFGWTRTATMNITGGTMNMTGSGSLWNIGHSSKSYINVSGSGVANFTGGIQLLNGSEINNNGGSLNITKTTGELFVYGGSQINQLSGTSTVNGDNGFFLGGGGSTGTLNISGGTWQQNGYVRMGVFGSGNGVTARPLAKGCAQGGLLVRGVGAEGRGAERFDRDPVCQDHGGIDAVQRGAGHCPQRPDRTILGHGLALVRRKWVRCRGYRGRARRALRR